MSLPEIPTVVPDIYVIANSPELAVNVREVCEKNHFTNVGCTVALLDEGLKIANIVKKRGAKVLVSRKGIADLLIKYSGMDVVTITTTINDYLDLIGPMKNHDGVLGILEYETYIPELKRLVKNLGLKNVKLFSYSGLDNYASVVQDAVNSKCALLIGGGRLLQEEAKKKEIPLGVVENTKESILLALNTAQQIVNVKKQEELKRQQAQIKNKRYQAVLNHSPESIISVDANNKIQYVNSRGEKLFEKISEKYVGCNLEHIFPELALPDQINQQSSNKIINHNKKRLSADFIPVFVDNIFVSGVYFIRDILEIQKTENDLRNKLNTKGNKATYTFNDILCCGELIKRTKYIANRYAQTNAPIMLYGETGVGKELFAQSIHNASNRADKAFVAINCASLGKELLESRLFGYSDGAFTGAVKGGRPGLFEMAHGGTIFLDEIGEIPLETQAQLLRVLQEKYVRRIGSEYTLSVDVRVIAATNKNLVESVQMGRFRQDLYYRLNVLVLNIPALRERKDDIVMIFKNFINDESIINSPEFHHIIPLLLDYSWPGNVRELWTVAERFKLLYKGDFANLISEIMYGNNTKKYNIVDNSNEKKFEEKYLKTNINKYDLEQALEICHYNKAKVSAMLQISRSTLWRLMKKHEIM